MHLARLAGAKRARAVAGRLKRLAYFTDTHIWSELDPSSLPPGRDLPEGLELRRAGDADVDLLDRLPSVVAPDGIVDAALARRRIADGAVLWFVLDADEPIVCIWTFSGRAPSVAASDGWLPLPPDSVSIEDAVTAPERRGEGIAPYAVRDITRALAATGLRRTLMQAHMRNAASRAAVRRLGGAQVASIALLRLGPYRRVRVRPVGDGVAAFFDAALERR